MTCRQTNHHQNSKRSVKRSAPELASPWRVCLLAFALVVALFSARAAPVSAEFDAANQLYEQGKFAEAAKGFQRILASGEASAALYFNLGNAFFKAGELGRALAAYQQAEQLAPRDPDLRANLQFARKQVQGPTLPAGWRQRWLGQLTLDEWTWLTMGALWLWILVLTFQQVRPPSRRTLHNYTILLGLASGVLCVCLFAAWQDRSAPAAIVIAPEAAARQAPLEAAAPVFTAHDGAELEVLDRKGDWLQVSAGARNMGWIRRDDALVRSSGSETRVRPQSWVGPPRRGGRGAALSAKAPYLTEGVRTRRD